MRDKRTPKDVCGEANLGTTRRKLFKCFATSRSSSVELASYLRRMVLVPENTLERLQQRQQILTPPVTQTLKNLDSQIGGYFRK